MTEKGGNYPYGETVRRPEFETPVTNNRNRTEQTIPYNGRIGIPLSSKASNSM